MNLFDLLPDQLFHVFYGSNRRVMADALSILFEKTSYGLSYSLTKDEAVFLLSEYFSSAKIDSEEGTIDDQREAALFCLKRLKDCGWLDEETGEDYQVFVHFQDYAIEIMQTLTRLNRSGNEEYSGYIYTIYQLLKNFEEKNGDVVIEQIYTNTNELFRRLAALNTNIKKYIQRLLDKKNRDDLIVLMNMLLDEYQNRIVDRAYYNLTTRDHPDKYRLKIIELTEKIYNNEDLMDSLARQFMSRKEIPYDEALSTLDEQMNRILLSFENIPELMEDIDRKHNRYVTSALARITFLLEVHDDIEGKINRILKGILNGSISYESVFRLSKVLYLDSESLYTPKKQRVKLKQSSIELMENDENALKEFEELLKMDMRYSKGSIEETMIQKLGDRHYLEASEYPIDSFEDFAVLVLTYLYGSSQDSKIEIEDKENVIRNGKFTYRNFVIRRRNHG